MNGRKGSEAIGTVKSFKNVCSKKFSEKWKGEPL